MGTELTAADVVLRGVGFDAVARLIDQTVAGMVNMQNVTLRSLDLINKANIDRAENEKKAAAAAVESRKSAALSVEQVEAKLSAFLMRGVIEQNAIHAAASRQRKKWTEEERSAILANHNLQREKAEQNLVVARNKGATSIGAAGLLGKMTPAEAGAAKLKGGMIAGQLLVGLQDGITVYQGGGGIGRAFMSSFNNIIQAASLAGPQGQIIATVGVVGVQVAQMLMSYASGAEDAKKKSEALLETIQKIVSETRQSLSLGGGDFLREVDETARKLATVRSEIARIQQMRQMNQSQGIYFQQGAVQNFYGKSMANQKVQESKSNDEAFKNTLSDLEKQQALLQGIADEQQTLGSQAHSSMVWDSQKARGEEVRDYNASREKARMDESRKAVIAEIHSQQELDDIIAGAQENLNDLGTQRTDAAFKTGDQAAVDREFKPKIDQQRAIIEDAEKRKADLASEFSKNYVQTENQRIAAVQQAADAGRKDAVGQINSQEELQDVLDETQQSLNSLYEEKKNAASPEARAAIDREISSQSALAEAIKARQRQVADGERAKFEASRIDTRPTSVSRWLAENEQRRSMQENSRGMSQVFNADKAQQIKDAALAALKQEEAAGTLTKQRQEMLNQIIQDADGRITAINQEEFQREVAREKAMRQATTFSFASLGNAINTMNHDDERKKQHDRTNTELKAQTKFLSDTLDEIRKPKVAVAG